LSTQTVIQQTAYDLTRSNNIFILNDVRLYITVTLGKHSNATSLKKKNNTD